MANHQLEHLGEEFKDEKTKKPSVIEKKSAAGQNTNVADHPLIYASAVKESLANMYGRKLGSFAERSFNSTLRILKVISDSASPHQLDTLEKSKLEIGDVSEAALGANTELEDDLVTPIMNCLVSSVINALAWILYISNVFSQPSTSICLAFEEERSSGGLPSQVSTEFINMLMCRHRFWVQMYFGVLMIFVLTYLIINRSSGTKKRKRTTYSLLSFGIVSCLLGKFCVDTLGQSICKLWLFLWAMLCLCHYVADVFILALVGLLYGPLNVTRRTESSTIVPYWACGSFLLVASLLVLPLIIGFLSFATFGEWRDHFSFITCAYKSWWFGL